MHSAARLCVVSGQRGARGRQHVYAAGGCGCLCVWVWMWIWGHVHVHVSAHSAARLCSFLVNGAPVDVSAYVQQVRYVSMHVNVHSAVFGSVLFLVNGGGRGKQIVYAFACGCAFGCMAMPRFWQENYLLTWPF